MKYAIIVFLTLFNILSANQLNMLQEANKTNKDSTTFTKQEIEYLKNKKQINMCIDPDWLPFEKIDEKGKHIGLSANYWRIFEEKIGIDVNLVHTKSWPQSLEFAKNRNCDVLSLAMSTPERASYLNFTKPYLQVPLVLATTTDKHFISDFDGLSEMENIGIPKGYAFVELLKIKYPNLNIIEVKNAT
jgi:ABC-type amino acid transport substrate-binding protein